MKSKVYFTKELSPEAVVKAYNALGITLPGKVVVTTEIGAETLLPQPGGELLPRIC